VTIAPPDPIRFAAEGPAAQLFRWIGGDPMPPMEVLVEGPAGTGKTRTIAEWVRMVQIRYPDSKGLLVRKTRVSLNDSVLPIYEDEVWGADHPMILGGPKRKSRDSYEWPGLGTVILGGIDNPTKLFSTQYDWVWVNEAQELTQEDWESFHRALRRPFSSVPWTLLVGDVNPEAETHHLNVRFNRMEGTTDELTGLIRGQRIVTRLHHNPVMFDPATREWTQAGKQFIARQIGGLTGVRYKRLYEGQWVSAEGQVWANWDPAVHLITGTVTVDDHGRRMLTVVGWEHPIHLRWFAGAYDYGYDAPGCFQVWGFDGDGRAYRVAEVYRRRWDTEQWSDAVVGLNETYPMRAIISDHDPAFISHINNRLSSIGGRDVGAIAREANKHRGKGAEKAGIERVRIRLNPAGDGRPRLFVLRDAFPLGIDQELRADGKPVCLEEEIPAYVYPVTESGKPIKDEPDPGCADHACDTTRYLMDWAEVRDKSKDPPEPIFPAGSVNHLLGLEEQWRKMGWKRPPGSSK